MKHLSSLAAAATLAIGALTSGQAMATNICDNCQYNGSTYLGAHNTLTFDSSGFRHDGILGGGASFTDTWIFDLFPAAGTAEATTSFVPSTSISGFTITLRQVLPAFLGTCTTVGSSCSVIPVLGAVITPGITTGTAAIVNQTMLVAGRYALQISGTNNAPVANQGVQYSGQLSTNPLPEPASVALVGVALLGAAASLRRNRRA